MHRRVFVMHEKHLMATHNPCSNQKSISSSVIFSILTPLKSYYIYMGYNVKMFVIVFLLFLNKVVFAFVLLHVKVH